MLLLEVTSRSRARRSASRTAFLQVLGFSMRLNTSKLVKPGNARAASARDEKVRHSGSPMRRT